MIRSNEQASNGPAAEETAGGGPHRDFIRAIVHEDVKAGKHGGRVVTRWPPEPNGFMHIGHATAVHLNHGIAREFGGTFHLRFDDTNPETEDIKYVDAITADVRWLGYEWGEHLYFASDYFEQMYEFAEHLIREGKAYVDSSDEEQIREYRGSVAEPGRPTPYRDRTVDENLDLFRRMRAGEFPDGSHVLRGKIDLGSPNMLLRDPILYRIRHAEHYRSGGRWCIYPLYDYAHPIEDAIENITHSICTLEFENNRPLYDWVVENLPRRGPGAHVPSDSWPRQYEFARRNLDYTVMSKRKFLALINEGHVSGWDDPRMPTVSALRRRGVTPEAVRAFADMAGVGRNEMSMDVGKLEFAVRDHLNFKAPRVLCVLRPLRVVLTNYPENHDELLDAPYFPADVGREGSRKIPFSRVLYIDRDDFHEDPPKGYHRLAPGREVRLRYAYVIRCDEVVRDDAGQVVELRCSYDESTRGGRAGEGRTVKGTIHWVAADHSLPCEVRLYDRLFTVPDPDASEEDFRTFLNPKSLVVEAGARVEPSVASDPADTRYQFERLGYFWRDPVDSRPDALVFNRTVTLRDTWARQTGGQEREAPRPEPKPKTPKVERNTTSATPAEPARSPALEERRRRYREDLGVAEIDAEILTRDEATANLFEAALAAGAPARAVANWVVNELPREIGDRTLENLAFSGRELGELVGLVEGGTISSSAGRQVLAAMVETGEAPGTVVERLGLQQVSDAAELRPIVAEIVAANAAKADEYRAGRTGLLGFFTGQVMRRTGGRANPEVVKGLLEEELGG